MCFYTYDKTFSLWIVEKKLFNSFITEIFLITVVVKKLHQFSTFSAENHNINKQTFNDFLNNSTITTHKKKLCIRELLNSLFSMSHRLEVLS